jgi:hypothetical protein
VITITAHACSHLQKVINSNFTHIDVDNEIVLPICDEKRKFMNICNTGRVCLSQMDPIYSGHEPESTVRFIVCKGEFSECVAGDNGEW